MQYNKVLTDKDREYHKDTIDLMYRVLPMSGHKITDAMVQEAFVYDVAISFLPPRTKAPRILAAGAYHDVAAELLRYNGYGVYDVDPAINYDLHNYITLLPNHFNNMYDGIVSTSVLEHTTNDIEFIDDCCALLKKGGICVMTMDFKDDWKDGQAVPYTSNRFYTQVRLNYLRQILIDNDCDLVDEPDWSGKDRFVWDGINYSFASFVFKKKDNL